jgi:hypothetical protein
MKVNAITDYAKTYGRVTRPIRGHKYHVAWAEKNGENPYTFRLIDFGETHCVLKADTRKKMITCELSELLHSKASAKAHNNRIKLA